MRRALLIALAALVAGGCGGGGGEDKTASFKKDYPPLGRKLTALGTELAGAIQTASDKTDAVLATQFGGIAKRAKAIDDDIKALDPPKEFKADRDQLTGALDRAVKDLEDITDAARNHDADAARTAAQALVQDSAPVSAANKRLKANTAK